MIIASWLRFSPREVSEEWVVRICFRFWPPKKTCSSDMATRPLSGLPTATARTSQSAGLYRLPAESQMETIREEAGPLTNGKVSGHRLT
jgi:hypothetical protein